MGSRRRPGAPAPRRASPARLPAAAAGRAPARPPAALAPAEAPAPAPAWEQKPVVVLAIDLTFPTTLEAEARPFEPWTAARRWEQAIEEKVQGFGGDPPAAPVLAAHRRLRRAPDAGAAAAAGGAGGAGHPAARDGGPVGAAREPVPEVRQAVHLGTMLVETQAGALTERYQAEGETLSVAVRLLGHAAPGELLVSPQVGRLVAGWCELQAVRRAVRGGAHRRHGGVPGGRADAATLAAWRNWGHEP